MAHYPLYLQEVLRPHQLPGDPHPQAEGALRHHPLQPLDALHPCPLHLLELGARSCLHHHRHHHHHLALGTGQSLLHPLLLWRLAEAQPLVEVGGHFWIKSGREFS